MKRPYHTKNAAYWQDMLNQWQASGLTQREFCLQHNIDGGKFSRWKYTLRKREQIQAAQATQPTDNHQNNIHSFVPVKLKQTTKRDTKIILQLNQHARIEADIVLTEKNLLVLFEIMEVVL